MKRLVLAFLALLAFCAPAHAVPPSVLRAISGNPCTGLIIQLDFAGNRADCYGGRRIGSSVSAPTWTFSRGSTGYAADAAGVLHSFASGAPRITNLGLLVETSRTNRGLYSNDLTQSAWTKSSATVAMDQTGPDGVANSASSVTATGANATVLQSVTDASRQRLVSIYLKRITGSGTISVTGDGTNYFTQTLTTSWQRFTLAAATYANPNAGVKLATSGDVIAVAFVDIEDGAYATSPILTTSAQATRSSDTVTVGLPAKVGASTLIEGVQRGNTDTSGADNGAAVAIRKTGDGSNYLLSYVDLNGPSDASSFATGTIGDAGAITDTNAHVIGVSMTSGAWSWVKDGAAANNGTATFTTPTLADQLNIGMERNAVWHMNGYISRISLYGSALSAAQLKALAR